VWVASVLVCLAAAAGAAFADRGALQAAAPAEVDSVGTWIAPPVDSPALMAAEEVRRREGKRPRRVGFPMETDLSPANAGTWRERPGGGWSWGLRVRSEGALWTVLGFDEFRLPPGASLRAYDPAGRRVLGPFTSDDVRADGELWLPPVAGDTLVIELDWPLELRSEQPAIHLGTVSHGYLPWGGIGAVESFAAGDCHIDINCPLGDAWQYQKRGVVRLLIGGSVDCSGSLINNTSLDCTPYVLTAEHCYDGGGTPAGTTFLFDYELPACEPGAVPQNHGRTGSVLRASHVASDHRLLEITSPPPASWNVFFSGWSRSTVPATESWTIHHPMGDVKKITHDADPLVDGIDQGPDHWRVNQWEEGSTDPGSSASTCSQQATAPSRSPGRIAGSFTLSSGYPS